jgi:hypothetical protein
MAGLSPESTHSAARLFLIFWAVSHNSNDGPRVGLDYNTRVDATGLGDFFKSHDGVQIGKALTAVAFRHSHSHEPGVVQFMDVVPWIGFITVNPGRLGANLLVGEFARRVLKLALGLGQFKQFSSPVLQVAA